METIGNRISKARKLRDLTGLELGKLLGVKQSVISQWETGSRSRPRIDTLKRIAEALDISLDWLTTGDGEMEKSYKNGGATCTAVQPATSHLRDLRSLEAQNSTKEGEQDALPGIPGAFEVRWIPTLGLVPGGPPFEPSVVPLGMLPVPADVIKHPRAFALRVMGYSMTPIIDDGDIIACEPYEGERLAPGAIVVAMVQGESTVKLYSARSGEHLLIAISGPVKPIRLQEGDYIFAVVKLVSRPPEPIPN